MITKQRTIGHVGITEDRILQIREDTVVSEDGVELVRKFFRRILEPGDDVSSEPALIRNLTQLLWTQAVVDTYRQKKLEAARRV